MDTCHMKQNHFKNLTLLSDQNFSENCTEDDNKTLYYDFTDIFMTKGNTSFQITIAKKIAIVLSILAIIANVLSLLAIVKIRKKLNANLRLTTSLCIADILVAVSLLRLSTNTSLVPFSESSTEACLFQIFKGIRMSAHIMTLFNLLGLALDHFYAIVRTLHYKSVMSTRKITWAILISWIISFLLGFSDMYMPSSLFSHCEEDEKDNYTSEASLCNHASCTVFDSEHVLYVTALITFCSIVYFYTAIFIQLQKKVTIVCVQHRGILQRRKRGLCTTMLILVTFIVCWLPYCLFDITVNFILVSSPYSLPDPKLLLLHARANYFLYDLILLNSLCDPLIYAWRMREVQRGYRHLFRMFPFPICKKRSASSFSRSSGSRTPTTHTTTSFMKDWTKMNRIAEQRSMPEQLSQIGEK